MFELMAKLGEINIDEMKAVAVRFVDAIEGIRKQADAIEMKLDKLSNQLNGVDDDGH